MATLLRMPEPAAGATSATVSEWPIAEHTPFPVNAAIAVIETDKAIIEIEAESEGIILRALVPAGTEVDVGAPIALLGSPGEQAGDIDSLLAELGAAPSGPSQNTPPQDAGAPSQDTGAPPGAVEADPPPNVDPARGRVFASPLARRLAREAGLTIDQIPGTGPGGRIVRRDVEAAAEAALARRSSTSTSATPPSPAGPPAAPVVAAPPPYTAPAPSPSATHDEIPHSRIRRAIAARLVESKQTAPHFYVRGTARVEALLAARAQLNRDGAPKVSVNDMVVKAVARAHLLVPEMNVVWTPDAVRRHAHVDVSVAIATGTGLLTPVLREVDTMPIAAVAETTRRYAAAAREGRLRQNELEGGTITVTNLGMFGVEEFAAIINPPQSSILAVGTARAEPVVTDGAVVAGTTVRFVLSVDHRPIDGTVAARWMSEFVALIENPVRIFA